MIELGGLYKDGEVQNRPAKPWQLDDGLYGLTSFEAGDVADFSAMPDMAKWVIGDTPAPAEQRLRWYKIKDGNKTVWVCDRVILARVSWQDLNYEGYIEGKRIRIDGRYYRCRLLFGGSRARDAQANDGAMGGFPTGNEWDRWIGGEAGLAGLPVPAERDLNFGSYDTAAPVQDAHNQWWNWRFIWSWCSETVEGVPKWAVRRGSISARYWSFENVDARRGDTGWRPVLEEIDD